MFFQVKVILKVCADLSSIAIDDGQTNIFNIDKKKKQIALYEPVSANASLDAADERKPSTTAPKMFAFDALFSNDDSQVYCFIVFLSLSHLSNFKDVTTK